MGWEMTTYMLTKGLTKCPPVGGRNQWWDQGENHDMVWFCLYTFAAQYILRYYFGWTWSLYWLTRGWAPAPTQGCWNTSPSSKKWVGLTDTAVNCCILCLQGKAKSIQPLIQKIYRLLVPLFLIIGIIGINPAYTIGERGVKGYQRLVEYHLYLALME